MGRKFDVTDIVVGAILAILWFVLCPALGEELQPQLAELEASEMPLAGVLAIIFRAAIPSWTDVIGWILHVLIAIVWAWKYID